MRLAIREAMRGLGQTSPNPAVGALIVRNGRILARGFHHAAGKPHAEIEALGALRLPALARGATLYVTLEPCSTHGRTPPCTDAIRSAGIRRVVIGAIDPNPRHAGRARQVLETAGITVTAGVLGEECRQLNVAFNRWIVTGMPWVIAKAALTLDGRLTRPPGEDRWLSGPASRAHAHRQRALVDAILVGAGTVRADNPQLTVRGVKGARQPWRIVVTRSGNLPLGAHLFSDAWKDRTLVFRRRGLKTVLRELGRKGLTSVLIEGGSETLGEAFAAGLVDEVQFYLTPWIVGGPKLAVPRQRNFPPFALSSPIYKKIGKDIFLRAKVVKAT